MMYNPIPKDDYKGPGFYIARDRDDKLWIIRDDVRPKAIGPAPYAFPYGLLVLEGPFQGHLNINRKWCPDRLPLARKRALERALQEAA
jgi:hypothetical protein